MAKKSNGGLSLGISEENKLFLQMVAYILNRNIGDYDYDPSTDMTRCFVKLTPELVEHFLELLGNSSKEAWDDFVYPYNGWGEEEDADFRKHIGETILLSCFDDPWDTVMEDTALPMGVKLYYADELLGSSLGIIDDNLFRDESCGIYDFRRLKVAILLLKANGMSDNDVFKLMKKEIKEEMTFIDE